MYRDDGEAAHLRIQTLEARLAEREAGLAARDAEIAELQAEVTRFRGHAPRSAWPRVWPLLAALGSGALGLAAGTLMGMPPHGSVQTPLGVTGIAACDLYLERAESCATRSPPAVREPWRDALKATRDAFRQTAETPEGRAGLRTACPTMLDSLASNAMCKP